VYGLIDAFIDRSRATILFLIVLIIWGYIAYTNIPKESTPDVKIPIIYVLVTHEGISPEDGQRLILRPLENALRGIAGLKEMTSYASEGSASVIMEFKAGFDSEKALRDVRSKVDDTERDLPDDSDKPTISEVNLGLFPVLNVILTGDIPERTLIKIARDLQNKVEAVPGVLEVKIGGDRIDSLEIIVEPKLIEGYGLSVQTVKQIIDSNNKLVAAGSLRGKTGEFAIKVPSLISDLDSLLNFPVKVSGDKTLRVRDIAEVRRTFKEAKDVARVNGKSAVVLEVSKRTGENIISTIARVKEVVEQEKLVWPDKLELIYGQDQSDQIIDMISDLENNIIFGVILVMIVVILSVGYKPALLISLSIPTSFLAGILLLSMFNLTLNIVVLFSLILTIGMIVDDAIVVSEYADRLMINGTPKSRAFVEAAKRMLWPIITSTLVKIVVFLPLLVWPGVVGQFMKYMPITVIVILSNSLIFALFFQPTLGPLIGKDDEYDQEKLESYHAADTGDLTQVKGLSNLYLGFLNKALDAPKRFVMLIFGSLVAVYIAFFMFGTGVEFFPKIEPDTARLTVQSPGNLSLIERDGIMQDIESRLLDMNNEVKIFYSKAGRFDNDNQIPEGTIGTMFIEFIDWQDRRKAQYILEDIKGRLKGILGAKVEITENRPGPPPEKPISINITSPIYDLVPPIADQILDVMSKMEGLEYIEDSRSASAIEWQIITNRELAARYGVDISTIGNTIRLITNGMKISSYRPEDADDEVDILLKFPDEYKSISTLDNINVVTMDGGVVPISNFVEKVAKPQVGKIKRTNRERVVSIKADVARGFLVDQKVQEIKSYIAKAGFDRGVNISFKGEDEDQAEAANFLKGAFSLALILMFMIMLIQFNNIYHTIIIMSAVFLSTVGVLIGLLITGQPFGIVMCGVGVIALAGIVLNNNILFVDTYQHLRREKVPVREAIQRAGIQRLRPILLTAATAVLGLIPMVFGLTIDFMQREITYDAPSSQWWRQLSASIAGGLTFATILTLFFTPCLLMIGKRFDRYKD
jgi:multidrug efflux pump